MAYFVLGAIVLVLGWLFISQLQSMKARSIRLLVLGLVFALAAAALLVFVLSGRYGLAAPAGAVALWVMRAYLLARQIRANTQTSQNAPPPQSSSGQMSRAEALDILGLEDGASHDEIEEAYKALIVKNHPDQGGTDWLAARLNEARDYLLSD